MIPGTRLYIIHENALLHKQLLRKLQDYFHFSNIKMTLLLRSYFLNDYDSLHRSSKKDANVQ
jgi:hypothetical protein